MVQNPFGTEVEIVNKDSRYFRRKGILVSPAPGGAGYCIGLENGEADFSVIMNFTSTKYFNLGQTGCKNIITKLQSELSI